MHKIVKYCTHWFRKISVTALAVLVLPAVVQATFLSETFETSTADSSEIFLVVEQMPEIIGGLPALYKEIRYPDAAIRNGVEGRVFLQFVVDESGQASDVEIMRDIGSGCGEAAAEAIKRVSFTPGIQNGNAVKVRFSLPVTFRINN